MRNTTPWLVVIIAIAMLSLYMVWPNNPGLFGRPVVIRPGLDVQGGLRVLMQAQGQEITSEKMDEVRRVIDRRVNALGVAEPVVQVAGNNRVIVELPGIQNPEAAISIIQQTALLEFVNFSSVPGCTQAMPVAGQYILTDRQVQIRGSQGTTSTTPTPEATAEATAAATLQATGEATTQPTSEATGEATTEATAEATPGQFKPAQTPDPTSEATPEATPIATAVATGEPTTEPTTEPTAQPTAAATPPAESTPEPFGSKNNPLINPCTGQPFQTVMTGAGLQNAEARIGGSGQAQYVVSFGLVSGNVEAQAFSAHTKANIQQPMAIVLDGEVLSAPVIQSELTDGGEITGNFSQEEARTLALQLRSGALPVSLTIESLEQVGASLGQESVAAAVKAGLLGLLAIFIFLIVYYRVGGVAAALALILFALINFALYKFIPVTLTLSAITGFLISIGSAIDGNILIFERVKEEIRAGRPMLKAIDLGFSRAWTSIRDSNISTIMIGLILYFFGGQFGASAVRGFAVTLIMGLAINLFTAVVVTRVFVNLLVALGGERLRQMNVFGH